MAVKDLFLETLREVAEIARVSGEPLEKDEVRRYFAGMDLTEELEEKIYQYLSSVPGQGAESGCADSDHKTAAAEDDTSLDRLSDSAYYRMYLNEVREKGICSEEKMQELYRLLAAGGDVAGQIVDGWLMKIIRMAELYKESTVNMQDLIQEGNVALWVALGTIHEKMGAADMERHLQNSVREAFEAYIREAAGVSDQTQAMLAKAALLHEAQEFLASENAQTPSLREVSEYTHIPVEEIQNILALYEQTEN